MFVKYFEFFQYFKIFQIRDSRDINIIYVVGYIKNEMAEISSFGDFEKRRSKNSFSRDAYPEI